ncbi:hypothetical protein P8605_31630 [Streptomyces sp. T-3]|nr:hypothetical protein [Streptomyces sp. T-3]
MTTLACPVMTVRSRSAIAVLEVWRRQRIHGRHIPWGDREALPVDRHGLLVLVPGYVVEPDANRVRLWDVRKRQVVASVTPRTAVTSVVLSADGTRLATRGEEKVELWDTRAPRRLKTLPVPQGETAAFRPDNGALATVTTSEDDTVSFLTAGKPLHRPLSSTFTTALAFTNDSNVLAAGNHLGLVSLWDGDAKRRHRILLGTRGPGIRGVLCHPT